MNERKVLRAAWVTLFTGFLAFVGFAVNVALNGRASYLVLFILMLVGAAICLTLSILVFRYDLKRARRDDEPKPFVVY